LVLDFKLINTKILAGYNYCGIYFSCWKLMITI